MSENKIKRQLGVDDQKAHADDHDLWSRRGFLQTMGLAGGGSIAFGGMSINALAHNSLLTSVLNNGIEDRILVLIRLKGGNDGLNTIIPLFDYDTYAAHRPNLKINTEDISNLNQDFGIQNAMNNILPLWEDGAMKVINTVGYQDHSLSHFQSSDIMGSGNVNIKGSMDKSGVLGRYILDQDPDFLENLPPTPVAIKIASGSSNPFFNPEQIDLAVNFNNIQNLISIANSGTVFDAENLPDDCYYGEQIKFLRSLLNVTYEYGPIIRDAYNDGVNDVNYTNNPLSNQLEVIARLIKGGLGTKLFMVTLDGFDTHDNQKGPHRDRMQWIGDAISSFYKDLSFGGHDNRVLSMTMSEFGRRVSQTGSGAGTYGSDHGAAAPVMMFGPALNGNGFLGENPDLTNLDSNGNLTHSVDFRSIYATILESWLCLDPMGVDAILGEAFDRIDLGFDCTMVSTYDQLPFQQDVIHHKAYPTSYGGTIIEFEMARPGNINVSIYSILGQKLETLFTGYESSGKHTVVFNHAKYGLMTSPFVYKISDGTRSYSGKFIAAS